MTDAEPFLVLRFDTPAEYKAWLDEREKAWMKERVARVRRAQHKAEKRARELEEEVAELRRELVGSGTPLQRGDDDDLARLLRDAE